MGTKKVVALCLDLKLETGDYCFTNDEFGQLPNLRFLRVDYADLAGDFVRLLSQLRWLQWRGCPGNFSPTNFHLKNLVILDLTESHITDDWEVWSQIKMAKKLKVLDLSHCYGLRITPDFSTYTTLEKLILRYCRGLDQIGPSIGNLINLRLLDISDSSIIQLPDALGNLVKLEELKASNCYNLEGEIPSFIGRLSSLRILRLDYTRIHSLPTSICELSHLQTLDLFNCEVLQFLPELPLSLISLRVSSLSMDALPSLSNLTNLKELLLPDCLNLRELPGDIGKLSKLETLYLYQTNIRLLPAEISALSRLKQLEVKRCDNLRCILGLPSSLFKLCLDDCERLESLPDLSSLTHLSELILVDCERLCKLDGLDRLESLTYLKISNCTSLERLPDLSNLKKLRRW